MNLRESHEFNAAPAFVLFVVKVVVSLVVLSRNVSRETFLRE
jgi:hypothetical protein